MLYLLYIMDYHYSELNLPAADQHLTDTYERDYTSTYVIPKGEAEYEIRSTLMVDEGRFGVSVVMFDKYEELIWMGNQGGHVTSYYGPRMQRYTSFQIHESEEVRDIITLEHGIHILTKTTLRHQIRRGIPKHTHRSDNMTDMQCLLQINGSRVLMGGHQKKLIDLDLNQMTETVFNLEEEDCVVLKNGGGALAACGSVSGLVTLRDPRAPTRPVHTLRAHSACLSDLDMQGDLLITCGFSHSVGGVTVAEPYVSVWDVRCLREGSATRLYTPAPPLLLHFLPAVSGRAAAVAGDGHVAMLDLNAATDAQLHSHFQVDTHSSLCSVMDVSSSSQALVFGDQAGHLHLFSPRHNTEPVFNSFSRDTEFADAVEGVPFVSFTNTNFQYSSISLPPLTTGSKYFNELPEEFFKKTYRKPKPIDPEVLKTMKMQGPIGHAPNPKTFRRNQMPYIDDNLEDLNSPKPLDTKTNTPIPKHYQRIDVRYNKNGDNETEVENYNKTDFPGLEATLPNSYCNSMLQVLYYTLPIKDVLLTHTCAKEFCLSCQLGFLFRTLDESNGAACNASDFLRAFRTVPEAAALGLILPDRGECRVDMVSLIQSWNRFILHQMHYEILDTKKKEKALLVQNANSPPKSGSRLGNPPLNTAKMFSEDFKYTELEFLGSVSEFNCSDGEFSRDERWNQISVTSEEVEADAVPGATQNGPATNARITRDQSAVSTLFAIGRHQLNRCLKCNKEEERDVMLLACALQYPTPSTNKEPAVVPRPGFIELLRTSLASRRSTPAWCERCRRFSPTEQRGRIIRLPPILAINCGGVTAHEKAYWAKCVQKETPESAKRSGSGKPCRYGMQCVRPGCRFKHPERNSPSGFQSSSTKAATQDTHCVLPLQIMVKLQPDGEVQIDENNDMKSESQEKERKKEQLSSESKKRFRNSESSVEYTLSAAVFCVEDSPKNLVAYIRLPPDAAEQSWYLFNDLSIVPVTPEEVIQFSEWWKTPCVLIYTTHVNRT